MKNSSIDKDIAFFIAGSLRNDRRLRKWVLDRQGKSQTVATDVGE
jgi:hypothetical protein